MRVLTCALAVALALSVMPATAQTSGSHAGTWAFQTEPYGSDQFAVVMSGAATFTAVAPDRYDIRLIANELIIERVTGRTQLVTARQTCTGEADGAQLTISCEMAEPLEGYAPDNFILQQGDADQLIGVLSSNASSQVTFTRMR
jgi:hypothetical protein